MSTRAPLTPPDADLQDFPFMPLHVSRLRDSDLAAEESPEACWYAVMLWCASWHQLPAGSLPQSEGVLAKLAGLGRDVKTFRKHREGALRGWIECSDGRLYHPVVGEGVLVAWIEKLLQRGSSGAGNARRWSLEFDPSAIEAQISVAEALLRDLDPESRTLTKLKRRQSRPSSARNPDVIPVGSQETERETETRDNIVVVDERVRENRNDDPALAADAPLDVQLAFVVERAGISIDPSRPRWADEAKRLSGWLGKGYALEADILPAVDRTLEKLGEGVTISSLALIERDLFAARAKARVRTVPKPAASAPDFARADEPGNVGAWRCNVGEAIGAAAYSSWLAGAVCAIDGDELVVTAPNAFTASFIEANYRPAMEKHAALVLNVPLVRIVAVPEMSKAARG